MSNHLTEIVFRPSNPNSNSTGIKHHLEAREDIALEELTGDILKDHHCFSKADEHGYSDDIIVDTAWLFCKEFTDEGALDPGEEDGRYAVYFEGWDDSALEIAVMEVQDCLPKETIQEYDCGSLVYGAWKQCYNNDGRGGAIDYKCLRYTVRPYWMGDGGFWEVKNWTADEMDEDIIDGVNFNV